MKRPSSRLLLRLETALRRTRDPIEAACLRAERAGLLARHGQADEARAELAALQGQFALRPHPAVSAWLAMADAWLQGEGGNADAVAHDKLKRAQALSAAAALTPLHALSSAWLAQLDCVQRDWDGMARNAALALRLAGTEHPAARARACLVVAVACHFAERMDRAQSWYASAREHAQDEGDDATLSALNHAMTALRVQHAVQAAVFGGDAPGLARTAEVAVESTENFERWTGAALPGVALSLLRAAVASVQEQHDKALVLYERYAAGAVLRGSGLADLAWCRWQLGDAAGALRDAKSAKACIDAAKQVDERAVAHGRLAELFKRMGDEANGLRHEALAQECRAAHRRAQAQAMAALEAAQLKSPG